jgi:hypothetical protein
MAVFPRTVHIPLMPLPAGFASKPSPYTTGKFTKLENWWPAPEDDGSIQVVPGFLSLNTSLGSFEFKTIAYAEKTTQVRLKIVTGNTSVWTMTDAGVTASLTSGLTAGLRHSILTFQDLVLFFNGTDTPFKYNFTTVSDIGLTQPTVSSSTSALSGTEGNVKGVVKYFVSFMSTTTEGALSDAFGEIDAGNGNQIDLAAIPTGGGGVTARILYRTQDGFDYPFLLATIEDNTTTDFTDDIDDLDLGRPPKIHGAQPPFNFHYAILHFNRIWAAGGTAAPSDLYYTDLNEPESWYEFNFESIWKQDGDRITGLARDRQGILIFKNNHLYKMIGQDPQAQTMRITEISPSAQTDHTIGTPSHWSIASTPVGHIFYYNRGVYAVGEDCSLSYLSREIEDELHADINQAAQEVVVAAYWPDRRVYYLSVPTGSSTTPTRTYGLFVDTGAWFRVTEGFSALAVVETGTNGLPSDGFQLWGSRSSDSVSFPKAQVQRLDHPTTLTFDGDTITALADLPSLYLGDPGAVSRWLSYNVHVQTETTGSITTIFKFDATTASGTSATITLVNAGVNRHFKTVNVGEQANEMQITLKSVHATKRPKVYGLDVLGQALGRVSK